jgi:GNAT superfamily N-acetyltransferase
MIAIRSFQPGDQASARALIEAGLGAHFGHIDRNANPDLIDIQASYPAGQGAFFVAELYGEIIGTCGLLMESRSGRLVRVAVARQHRRMGVASALLRHAIAFARQRGLVELVAHTQPEWPDATGFYHSHGFKQFSRDDIDVHLRRSIG